MANLHFAFCQFQLNEYVMLCVASLALWLAWKYLVKQTSETRSIIACGHVPLTILVVLIRFWTAKALLRFGTLK